MDQRNLILAAIISIVILLGWQLLFEQPRIEEARRAAQQQATEQPAAEPGTAPQAPGAAPPTVPPPGGTPSGVATPGAPAPSTAPRAAALESAPRIKVMSPRLHGSISLQGAQIDDLTLADYHETVDRQSPEITLLSPSGAPKPYFAQFGWTAGDSSVALPSADTVWTTDSRELAPGKPVTLRWDNGQGLIFTRTLALDRNYMFTVTQHVQNTGDKPVTLYPYGLISRTGTPETLGYFILHEGLIGVFNGQLSEVDYDDLKDAKKYEKAAQSGWLGITDKYWLVSLIPDQKGEFTVAYRYTGQNNQDRYQTDYMGTAQVVPPRASVSVTNRLFAGAKEVRLLDDYAEKLNIALFDRAIDFGWFYYLTKPIFYVLDYFNRILGNFGLAILLLTVIIKLVFFPLANKSYRAMSRLKQLQPKMLALRERYPDDRAKQNEAMMRLYREEKVNPAAGCLPMVIQIPVFFALYKVLFVSIEMRHAPFFGWIQDLSAPDPTSLFNMFGLIPWTPPDFLMIGIWPLIMGLTMWLQQKLNPAPADPTQAKIFMLLPIVFTFILAPFPAGLVIYWAWNNVLSIAQQWVIMRRMGVTVSGQTVKVSASSAGSAAASAKPSGEATGKAANGADGSDAAKKSKGKGKRKAKGKTKAG